MRRFLAICLLVSSTALIEATSHAQQAPDPRAGVFSAEFPYESKFAEIHSHQLHYVDKGSGQIFLFLHGNPTSSYLWRNVMRYVEPSGRVVAVDNIGFGRSDKPAAGKELLITQNVFIEQLLGNGALTRHLSEAELDAYRAPFLEPSTRFPIYVWPNELPIAGEPARNVSVVAAVGAWLKSSQMPKLLQYASPGAIVSPTAAQWMAANYPNIETQFVGYGAHYIQEDNPEAIGRGIADWYRRTF